LILHLKEENMPVPVPKRRTSKSKRDMRASHWKAVAPVLGLCPQCHQPKMSYYACPKCGYYKGRKVMKSEEERSKKEEKE
jgi:large subunit ribosomal protein L32